MYFRRKLYEALNVPVSRLESESQFNIGRASEITRDELKFSKFVSRLRTKFSELFYDLLEKQLLLKGIMTKQEWEDIKQNVFFDFVEDNHFAELKDAEIMENRLRLLAEVDQFTGKYYSTAWIQKNVLHQTEEEIEQITKEIEDEIEDGDDGAYNDDEEEGGDEQPF